jgi:hypothetical protein
MKFTCLIASAALLCGYLMSAHAQQHGQHHTQHHGQSTHTQGSAHASPASSSTPALSEKSCRKGAFTDAMALMNASVRASQSLVQQSSARGVSVPLAELDSILGIAIHQASDEYACVKGVLVMGYDKNYADTIKLVIGHAQSRRLSPSTVALATQLLKSIEVSGKPVAPAARKP